MTVIWWRVMARCICRVDWRANIRMPAREWGWQWVFPSANRSTNVETGLTGRHHVSETGLQRTLKEALLRTTITKPASCHTLAPFLCDAHARIGGGHPHLAGFAGA